MGRLRIVSAAVVALALVGGFARGAELSKGTPDWKSAGPIAFGPNGLLFLADTKGAAIFAVDTGDRQPESAGATLKVEAVKEKLAGLLGTTPDRIAISDMAVNPASGKAYLAVTRGKGAEAAPALVRVDRSGKMEAVSLESVPFAKAELPNPVADRAPQKTAKKGMPGGRAQAITDMAYVDGRLYIAGLSNEEFSSRLLSIPYPFNAPGKSSSVEIYHGAHGRFETQAPVRTFVSYRINGEPYLLAAYTCTPLVKFPVAQLQPGKHVKGTTVAELGNHNNPLDMIVYQKDGKDYLLLTNTARGVMKIVTEGVDNAESITAPVRGGSGTAGQKYETIGDLKGVAQLDALDKGHALVVVEAPSGAVTLETIDLP